MRDKKYKIPGKRAFTLLEVIIVIVIIAVMAAICPSMNPASFREAGVRSKISRVKTDMRSLGTALEKYYTDWNTYPAYSADISENLFVNNANNPKTDHLKNIPTFKAITENYICSLTTPTAYLDNYYTDPFFKKTPVYFAYYADKNGWITWSTGPDLDYDLNFESVKKYYDSSILQPSVELNIMFAYDPTNGAISSGDIFRVKQ